MKHFPARVHILLARDAAVGMVIRRGPSKSVCTLLWDRLTDKFTLGQWMRGRIYERRSDLSPDGKHFIYFAMNGKWDSETKGSWTAISRTPYLKAVTLMAKGDCWAGGGLFTGANSYWLNDGYGHTEMHDAQEVIRDRGYVPSEHYGGECTGVYYLRLLRDGWRWGERTRQGRWEDMDVFEKDLPDGWTLRKFAHVEIGAPPRNGCYWDEHELEHSRQRKLIQCRTWQWAEVDHNRLVWVSEGKLYAGLIRNGETVEAELLHDFNSMTFEAIPAPY